MVQPSRKKTIFHPEDCQTLDSQRGCSISMLESFQRQLDKTLSKLVPALEGSLE